ncbi:fatty acid export 1 [Hibiscus trionum]|uniref:Fatty acid export 1 n=1 Tax=Hibiscus trionum TaxID=183268 RepID=A0A9W7MJ29_HIBTR|nr:fatty acid export 1 [Hibiscus trionum]
MYYLIVCVFFAALAAVLFWKNFKTYSLTKKLFPNALYAVISAAMLLFYSYVVISGGNPPPKKMKLSATH